ncbi:hypothetical protein Tco_0242928 [Tanacetum coccineum]
MEQEEVQNGCDDEKLGILTKRMVSTTRMDEKSSENSSRRQIELKILEYVFSRNMDSCSNLSSPNIDVAR